MRVSVLSLAFATLASPVFAACPVTQHTILSCSFEGGRKAVDVCHDTETASYAFGKVGREADLILYEQIRSLDYGPWNGMGAVMNEVISFENADVYYNVWMTSEMDPEKGDVEHAGVTVMLGPDEVVEFLCDAGSIKLGFETVYDAKQDMDLCYSNDELEWMACN